MSYEVILISYISSDTIVNINFYVIIHWYNFPTDHKNFKNESSEISTSFYKRSNTFENKTLSRKLYSRNRHRIFTFIAISICENSTERKQLSRILNVFALSSERSNVEIIIIIRAKTERGGSGDRFGVIRTGTLDVRTNNKCSSAALRGENTSARVAVLALSWRSRLMQLTAQLSQRGSHTVTPATKPTPRYLLPGSLKQPTPTPLSSSY